MWRELGQSRCQSYPLGFQFPLECGSHRRSNSRDPMDVSLFQFNVTGAVSSPKPFASSGVRAAACSGQRARSQTPMEKVTSNSRNLDLLRSFAVLLVVGFHLAKFFDWHLETLRVTDFGMLGVMLFFVHTTLVLMFSLERQSAGSNASLFVPFMVRRCFRIYPLAILLVTFAFLFHIPSDLQFGRFNLLHQSAGNFLANLLLDPKRDAGEGEPGHSVEPAAGTSDVPRPARLIPIRFAREVVVGNDRILVVRGRAMVCGGTLYRHAAPERGWHPVACGSAPEIHAIRAVFSSRDRGLQTLAPAQILAGRRLACFPGALLRGVSLAVRKSADRDGMVHLFRDRSGSVLLPGDAGKSAGAPDETNRPIFVWNLFVPLFGDLDRVCGLPELERRAANRDFRRGARVPLCCCSITPWKRP